MGTLITVSQVLLSLSLLIILHEWGHFYAAKTFKTRVEKFYLFFNPGFSLFKKQIGETEYGIGWLPLGGYVKISGMIDESMDKDQMAGPPLPHEFRSKPAWQRLIIMVGGVVVNFILGFFIFAMVLWYWGESFYPNENVTHGMAITDSLTYEMGFMDGDKIISIEDVPFTKFESSQLTREIVLNDASKVVVERQGRQVTLDIDEKYIAKLSEYGRGSLFQPRAKYVIDSVIVDGPAYKAGIRNTDKIVSVNGQPIEYNDQYNKAIKTSEGDVNIVVARNGIMDTLTLDPTIEMPGKVGMIGKLMGKKAEPIVLRASGIYSQPYQMQIDHEVKKYALAEAIPKGFTKGIGFIGTQLKAFKQMFQGKMDPTESVGGPIAIGTMFGDSWDWHRFWSITGMLSLILGFMNLLPIPALDGGYVLFLLFEMITGIKPNDRFMEITTTIGFVLLMTLMVFIFGIDISRFFK